VLSARLVPRTGPVLVKAARWAHYVISELLGNLLPQPSLTDLVVTRIADGSTVLRLPAGDLPAGEQLLQHVQVQLDELTVEEFLDRWGELSSVA
jgi:hypothetical protein